MLLERERGDDAQAHARHDAERAERDAGRGQLARVGLPDVAGRADDPQAGHQRREVAVREARPVRARGDRAGDALRQDRADDRQREPARGEILGEVAEARAALDGDLVAARDLDAAHAVEADVPAVGERDVAPAVAGADGLHALAARGGAREERGDLLLGGGFEAPERRAARRGRPVREQHARGVYDGPWICARCCFAKTHPSWGRFVDGALGRDELLVHYRHELAVTLRPWPRLLGRVAARAPDDARAFLDASIAAERGHEELFQRTMRALGLSAEELEGPLLSEAAAYLALLEAAADAPWRAGFAVLAIFVDGSARAPVTLTPEQIEWRIRAHPLVRHHGVPPSEMEAARVHLRAPRDPWPIWDAHAGDADADAIAWTSRALDAWLAFRGAVWR